MDKEKVVEALRLANDAMNEAKVCAWEYENDNASSMAMMELAGLILIGDAIRESAHPIHRFRTDNPYFQLGVDVLAKVGENKHPQSNEPDGTGYYWAVFPDGSARLVEIEVADSSKKGVYKVHLLDHSGETMATDEAKWIKISPQP
jgi:hypothetical protein